MANSVWKDIRSLSLFRSIRFNVGLFLLIAFLSALGTFIPQVTDNQDKVQDFLTNHADLGRLFQTWGLFDIYHTFLFAGLLALMAFDVVVCKLANTPPDHGLLPLAKDEEKEEVSVAALQRKPYRMSGVMDHDAAGSAQSLARKFKKERYAVREVALPGGGRAILASKHRAQRWGSYVSHIAIVVILFGAMLRSFIGFETFLPILEGRSSSVTESLLEKMEDAPRGGDTIDDKVQWILGAPHRWKNALGRLPLRKLENWRLTVNKMTVDFYHDSTTPSTFASDVLLEDGHTTLAKRVIRVNEPLDIHHIRFYQASWGVTGMVRKTQIKVDGKLRDFQMHDSFPVPGHPWQARVEYYLPDFSIGDDGQPTTQSLEWKNPALVFGFYNKEQTQLGTLAVGVPSPVTPKNAEPWAMFFEPSGNHFPLAHSPIEVVSADPTLFSGIQVTYDPGFPVLVVGVLSMLAGLCALFYLHQRRVLILLRSESAETTRIDIGAWSSRADKQFEEEFRRLFVHLKWKTVEENPSA